MPSAWSYKQHQIEALTGILEDLEGALVFGAGLDDRESREDYHRVLSDYLAVQDRLSALYGLEGG